MANEAIASRSIGAAAVGAAARARAALPGATGPVVVGSRVLVGAVAALTVWLLPVSANAERFDDPTLSTPAGGVLEALLSPLAHWDAVWYLGVASSGYGGAGPDEAFFPLYPLLVRALAPGGSPSLLLVSATLLSLACFVGAAILLRRLAALEAGPRAADAAVVLFALFPASLYFGAPYSESLFLLVSVGAFYAARTGNWALAGALAALASATRSAGLVLLVPLAILYLWGPRGDRPEPASPGNALRPRHALRPDAAWLLLAPLGAVAYSLYLWAVEGDPLAWMAVQDAWFREAAIPLSGAMDGTVAAFDGVRQLLSGQTEIVYWERAGGDPMEVARRNLFDFPFLVFALVAAVGVLRRLPAAYGAYVVAALALPLSFPVGPQPLMSLPRFVAVLFPLFIWLGIVCARRRSALGAAVAVSAAGLVLATVWFAQWEWVA